jgi:iron complex outermembrane recepter protein
MRHRALLSAPSPRLFGCLLFCISFASTSVQAVDVAALDIKRLTLEELADVDVYSASRRLESLQGTPSAIFVLTSEDIRRSRVRNIPDALRLIPGVQVARIDGNKWGVSIRGFIGLAGSGSARLANKLLVLVDGLSIYDPFFAGTFWEAQDRMLSDIDRIEVIRGPGGALWGANAVNGVINIITKHARETEGGLVELGGGTEERAFGDARYGWKIGDNQHARVYAKSVKRDTGWSPSYNPHDALSMYRTGFRWDREDGARDSLRVSGDWFGADAGQRSSATVTDNVDHNGGNLVTQWQRKLSATENLRVQLYYDYYDYGARTLTEERNTYDFELQHSMRWLERHNVVWGVGYRHTRDHIGTLTNAIDPSRRTDVTESAFFQDTIALVPEQLSFTLGTKFEHNDYTNNEWQPSARLAWTPNEREAWWAAVSRAVRIPSRLEADIVCRAPSVTCTPGTRLGEGMVTEKVHAYELGHRRLLTKDLWWDLAAFYNDYKELATIETGTLFKNRMHGHGKGAELAVRWQATPLWRLDAAYTYLKLKFAADAGSAAQPDTLVRSNPHHQFVLRSAWDITADILLDATLRHMDDLPALNVPAYTVLDLGLSWRTTPSLELSLVGQNLLDSHHPEQAVVANGAGTEVQRGYYALARWRF